MHWTYTECAPESDLQQGDIIEPSADLAAVLREVHPHFCDPKYLGFIVASQTCDLVLRKGEPKAPYISLGVIRPLVQILPGLLQQSLVPVKDGVPIFAQREKGEARQLLERLLDQNEQSLGLFYLHGDAEACGFIDPAVCLLRVTVSLKAIHYPILRASRRGRLASEFQGKLGWLLGNLYARPAAPDWVEKGSKRERDAIIKSHLEKSEWIDDRLVDAFRARKGQIESDSIGDVLEELERFRPPTALSEALDAILNEVAKVMSEASEEQRTKLRNRLKNNGVLTKLLK